MRRDLDIDCDPGQLVLAPPDRSQLKEIFRRFEFRDLLNRARRSSTTRFPAAPMEVTGVDGAVARGRARRSPAGSATRLPTTVRPSPTTTASSSARGPRRAEGELVVARREVARRRRGRRHAARRVPDRAGPRRPTSCPTSGPSTASSSCPTPAADEETAALVGAAELPRRLAPLDARAARGARA